MKIEFISNKEARLLEDVTVKLYDYHITVKSGLNKSKKQEQEARAYKADNTAVVPFISNLATSRGITVDLIADKIIVNADSFAVALGTLTGALQAKKEQVEACTTIEELNLTLGV